MGRDDEQVAQTAGHLTWALCVSTYNRIDVLEVCVRHALQQTRMPHEIVIVDASADLDGNSRRITAMAQAAGVPIRYLAAPKKALPSQRNHGIAAATADILFLIDDDAFLSPDCAETIMRIYEADRDGKIAAISASDGPMPGDTGRIGEAKVGASRTAFTTRLLANSRIVRFLWTELLMMSADRIFIPYDGCWHRPDEATVAAHFPGVAPLSTIFGYRMTVRRSVALAEPFDADLLAYASAEDLDATYRFSRHGWNVIAPGAMIYHHEAVAERLKRQQSTMLSVLNIAFLLRKNSRQPARDTIRLYIVVLRRGLAELLKDSLTRRWRFPQFLGVVKAGFISLSMLRHDRKTLPAFYDGIQRRVLGLPPAGSS